MKNYIRKKVNTIIQEYEKSKIFDNVMQFIKINNIKGDYLEFGTWKGHSLINAYKSAIRNGINDMKFLVFDSFKGLPRIKGIDRDSIFKEGDYACSYHEFKDHVFNTHKLDKKKIHIFRGWFKDVLNEKLKKRLRLNNIAIIYIDVDIYESCIPIFRFINDLIQDGTIIMFDDWFCFKGMSNKGEQKAFFDWTKKNKIRFTEYKDFNWSGKSFILYNKKK